MKYRLAKTTKFKKDLKKLILQGRNIKKLDEVVQKLANDIQLPPNNKDHNLSGNYAGYRECHVEPDLLLIYKKENDILLLTLVRTGSHSELF